MKERERAGLAVAMACGLLILWRALSPAFFAGFDWISLLLTLTAAAGLLLPALLRPASHRPLDEGTGPAPAALPWEAVRLRFAALGWSVQEGGVYDSLIRMAKEKPFVAVCGTYATLCLLIDQLSPASSPSQSLSGLAHSGLLSSQEAETLEALLTLSEDFAEQGASVAEPACAEALLTMALAALSRLERAA